MDAEWTKEQQQVIDTRGKNILVSAAAGSGKTAVLVARIIKMITDDIHPVDIDRILVVTFTNAAAAQMRSRIRDAIEERAMQEPDNIRLQRQLVLIHNAKITTVHSFCLNVLRNHFQMAGIDPSFRIADEGEVMLLEQDAVKETVDEAYENMDDEKNPDFAEFLEKFATGRGDSAVEDIILRLYHFSQGQPFPEDWLHQCLKDYDDDKTGDSWNPSWFAFIESETAARLEDIRKQSEEALRICREPEGPYPYEKALISDLDIISRLEKGKSYSDYIKNFRSMEPFARLGTKKDDNISEDKKKLVQSMRSEYKDQINALREEYYYDDPGTLHEEFLKSRVIVRVLTELTENFAKRLAKKKSEKNLLDFNDLEHMALNILTERHYEDGKTFFKTTAVAAEYAGTFEEVMIDEYQDTNLVQELILQSVSGNGKNASNMFMVGDVKQSIYRFRLARPELFMEKYHSYAKITEEIASASVRIDLHRNFRSRPQVLSFINYIFRKIMTSHLGGISYDDDEALYPAADFDEPVSDDLYRPEMLLFARNELPLDEDEQDELTDQNEEAKAEDLRREEARMAAYRIREIVGSMPVTDKAEGKVRPARYGDIVILLRTVSGWAETFQRELTDMGIPCYSGTQKGYFSATEVRVVLSYLKILDNPVQDIPLSAVLRSAIGNFSDEELARIRLADKEAADISFYDCCRNFLNVSDNDAQKSDPDDLKDEKTRKKLNEFFETYRYLRAKCDHTPVHLLLWDILDVTGYGEYVQALPAGKQRKANLDMLVEKAIAYEATSYRGLYHFVRYIENLQKYEVDYGEANLGSEADDIVKIMSIHKSKGLEFPIVFVSGLGKQFNKTDVRSRIVMDPELGIGCDYVYVPEEDDMEAPRMSRPTLLKKTIQQKITAENLGEELRVLYVAMTRAKEKLILTGGIKDSEKSMEKWRNAAKLGKDGKLSYSSLSGASSYLDWLVPAMIGLNGKICRDKCIFKVFNDVQNAANDQKEEGKNSPDFRKFLNINPGQVADEDAKEYLEEVFSTGYPFETACRLPGKVSVSEIKRLSQQSEENDARELYPDETVVPLIPDFRKGNSSIKGAALGTIYHTLMENLDFSGKKELLLQLEELVSCGKMSRNEADAVNMADIYDFLCSDIGVRVKNASMNGSLYREQPFVLGVPGDGELILIQGIIDAYFIEDGQITLLDYKTDKVTDRDILTKRYKMQMDYYEKALERLTGHAVRERIIYSFYLKEAVYL